MTHIVQHSSESVEWYTPPAVVHAARALLGGTIDLDPASCERAQSIVGARSWCGEHDDPDGIDALALGEWRSVLLNPPGGTLAKDDPRRREFATGSVSVAFWRALVGAWWAGRVHAAVFVAFKLDLLQTSQVLVGRDEANVTCQWALGRFPLCFPSRRLCYWQSTDDDPERPAGGPPHASALVYLPHTPRGIAGVGRADPTMYDAGIFAAHFGAFGNVCAPNAR